MKAIAPMVAVVLMLAFTIIIGGIISVWLSGLHLYDWQCIEWKNETTTRCEGIDWKTCIVDYEYGIVTLKDVPECDLARGCYKSYDQVCTKEGANCNPMNISSADKQIIYQDVGFKLACENLGGKPYFEGLCEITVCEQTRLVG